MKDIETEITLDALFDCIRSYEEAGHGHEVISFERSRTRTEKDHIKKVILRSVFNTKINNYSDDSYVDVVLTEKGREAHGLDKYTFKLINLRKHFLRTIAKQDQ